MPLGGQDYWEIGGRGAQPKLPESGSTTFAPSMCGQSETIASGHRIFICMKLVMGSEVSSTLKGMVIWAM